MSNGIAYPVFRTPDPALALSVARRLMEFGREDGFSRVSASAEFYSVAELVRVAKRLPAGRFRAQEECGEFDGVPLAEQPALVMGVEGADLPPDPASYEGRLPVEFNLYDGAVGSIEDAFTAAIGPNRGEINWRNLCWPDAPAQGLYRECTHAEVTLLFNTRTRDFDEAANDHTVLVHVRSVNVDGHQTMEPQAQWLAGRVGLTVLGPGQW
ncbi:hypothetical protein [Streptomyces yangpuensis]|uniref:hypothetical protein n=1 Tax=Streptomyces yangpuensis TaxID=1648182 RepID=UPI0036582173